MKTPSEAFLRHRRFLLVLPLLVFPFLAMAFWSLGGGGAGPDMPQALKGLNLRLPAPQLKKAESSKLRLYQQAQQRLQKPQDIGSRGFLDRLGLSPGGTENPEGTADGIAAVPSTGIMETTMAGLSPTMQDPNEAKIQERLSQLSHLVGPGMSAPMQKTPATGSTTDMRKDKGFSQDVNRLETMMHVLAEGSGSGPAADPEMQQLEGLLERILDIQHPERVNEKLQETSEGNPQVIFPVQAAPQGPAFTLLHQALFQGLPVSDTLSFPEAAQPSFFGLQGAQALPGQQGHTLVAVLPETQTLRTGAMVKLRLLQAAYLDGRRLPVGTPLYGTCQLRGERLTIQVNAIRSGNDLLAVSLAAYDLDGLEGLYIPGAGGRDAVRQGAGRVLSQSLQLPPLAGSLGAQAAGAGLEAARGLLGKEVRQVKVTVKAGHRLLLRDQKTTR